MKLLNVLILALIMLACAGVTTAGTLSPGLQNQISTLQDSDMIKVLVVMKEQADIKTLDRELHTQKVTLAARHQTVVELLQDTAKRTQSGLLDALDSHKDTGGIQGWTSHWLINGVVVKGSVATIRELALRADVEIIEADLVVELIEPVESGQGSDKSPADLGVLPGIEAIQAPRVWEELGVRGEGALVAELDTGVDGDHPALAARWRGNFAPAAECWLDIVGFGDPTPEDYHDHGTHTMGTLCGLAPGDTIGVAPEALWIASNVINQGVGTEFDNDVLASLEWVADPDGDPGTIVDVPDVVQNSWGVNEFFPGYVDCDSRWWDAIDNTEAAGVVVTWSAGNEGPGSGSLRSPADRAASPTNIFSVGSTVTYPPYAISSFSSRGPAGPNCGPEEFRVKPEVVAPGSDILSARPGGGYQMMSGTSMAGPHVAGVVALMRSANPNLDVITVKEILMQTAGDLGTPGEDNTYGHGFINAYEAVLFAMTGLGTVEGTVTDAGTGLPITFAVVRDVGGFNVQTTDDNGAYAMSLSAEEHTLEFSAFGYYTEQHTIVVTEGETYLLDVDLTLAPQTRLWGYVFDAEGLLLPGATIMALGTPADPVLSEADGSYEIFLPDGATYEVQAAYPGLTTVVRMVELNGEIQLNFVLREAVIHYPLLDMSFTSVDFTTLPDMIKVQNRYFGNLGSGNLNYWLTVEAVEGKALAAPPRSSVQAVPHLDLVKGEEDPRPGVAPVTGHGGPDGFGYTWIDSDEVGGPVYDWVEISGIGTFVGSGDDVNHGPFPLGFTFNFYGTDFTTIRVCTNGFLSFTSSSNVWSNDPIPSTTQPNNLLAPFWDDLNPNSGGTIYYYQDTANTRFIVEWDGVPHYSSGGPETFQAILYADGRIVYQYQTVDTGNSSTVGIENASGTDGLQMVFNSVYLHDELAIRIAAFSAVPWVEVLPLGGTIEPGQRQRLQFTYDSTGLALGTYEALLRIHSNDPINALVEIPILLNVANDITDVGGGQAPDVFALNGAHPNPFNPMTEIAFSLPSAGLTNLQIYDIAGRLIRTLVSESYPAGAHSVRWNGLDDSGRAVASGTYYARLRMGDLVEVRPMVLVR